MMEGSRLGRESIETLYVLKRIVAAGVRVFHYLDDRERTLNDPMERLHAQVLAFSDEMERERARQRTKDALLRRARHGHVTGGRVFGYDNPAMPDAAGRRAHVERVVNDEEAAVVRRIFDLCGHGHGLRAISTILNDEKAPNPLPRQKGRPRGWCPSSVRGVLYRRLYIGRLVWNRTRKRDQWGAKQQADRPASEWIETAVPTLRIVPDAAWDRAHERLRGVREGYQRATGGVMHGRPLNGVESKYLLTGFATCGVCNGSLHVRSRKSGGARQHVYACSVSFHRGRSICDNRALLPLEVTERAVLDAIESQVLDPEVIRRALRKVEAHLRAPAAVDRKAVRDELHNLDTQQGHLASAIKLGGDLPVLVEELRGVERQRTRLLALLRAEAAPPTDWPKIERELQRRLTDWHGQLRRHAFKARNLLRTLMAGKILFTPTAATRDGAPAVRFRVECGIASVLDGITAMVAPRGFDTFALRSFAGVVRVA